MDLNGRRALVTGSAKGIGESVVRRLAADGASVVVDYRSSAQAAEALVEDLRSSGATAHAVQGDVTDPQTCRDLVAATVERLGGLDVLVSNAGVEHFGDLASITRDDVDRVFSTNVYGQLWAAQAAAAVMGRGGRIVLTSSVSATMPVRDHTLYAASKAAVSAMVANLALELAERGIAVNAVAPGGTATAMASDVGEKYVPRALRDLPSERTATLSTALGRMADPEEIAAVVSFLVSSDASYVTGSVLAVDGGRTG